MKRGTKPKPSRLKVLQGNPGKRQVPEDVAYPIGWPPMPDFLDDLGEQVWKETMTELEAAGVVALVDKWVLAGYCAAVSRAVRSEERSFTDKSQEVDARKNWDQVRLYGAVFGIGPAERHRVPKSAGAPLKSKLAKYVTS